MPNFIRHIEKKETLSKSIFIKKSVRVVINNNLPERKKFQKDIKGYYFQKKPWYNKKRDTDPNPKRKKPLNSKNPKPYPTVNESK